MSAEEQARRDSIMAQVVTDDVASLIRSLHERAQQAEATRDAAQARATACEERARRAEQQASDASFLLIEAEKDLGEAMSLLGKVTDRLDAMMPFVEEDDTEEWSDAQILIAETLLFLDRMPDIDPAAGTGDHGREAGRNGE